MSVYVLWLQAHHCRFIYKHTHSSKLLTWFEIMLKPLGWFAYTSFIYQYLKPVSIRTPSILVFRWRHTSCVTQNVVCLMLVLDVNHCLVICNFYRANTYYLIPNHPLLLNLTKKWLNSLSLKIRIKNLEETNALLCTLKVMWKTHTKAQQAVKLFLCVFISYNVTFWRLSSWNVHLKPSKQPFNAQKCEVCYSQESVVGKLLPKCNIFHITSYLYLKVIRFFTILRHFCYSWGMPLPSDQVHCKPLASC